MKKCFYPTCNQGNPLWEVYLEDFSTPINHACTEHVGHAIAVYQCSTDQEPVRQNHTYIVRMKKQ